MPVFAYATFLPLYTRTHYNALVLLNAFYVPAFPFLFYKNCTYIYRIKGVCSTEKINTFSVARCCRVIQKYEGSVPRAREIIYIYIYIQFPDSFYSQEIISVIILNLGNRAYIYSPIYYLLIL